MPAAVYIETHGGTGIGGSDDHAGVDIGRTFTEAPAASTPEEFLRHLRARRRRAPAASRAAPPSGPTRRWRSPPARSRSTARPGGEGAPDPAAVLKMAERVIGEGAAREGKVAADIGPEDARGLLEAWLAAVGLDAARPRADRLPAGRRLLPRRALPPRPPHPRAAAARGGRRAAAPRRPRAATCRRRRRRPLRGARPGRPVRARDRLPRRGEGEARRPRERAAAGRADRRRDRLDARRHPHDRADPRARRARLRGRGDRHRPRRRPAPAGRGRARGALLRGHEARRPRPARPGRDAGRGPLRPRPRHRARPGRRRRDAARPDHRACRCSAATTPSSPPTPGLRSGDDGVEAIARAALGAFYGAPSRRPLAEPGGRRARWSRSASTRPGSAAGSAGWTSPASIPAKADRDAYPGEVKVLYAGRLTREKGVDLLAESFLRAHARRPAPAPAARRRRPRGGRAAGAARRARDLPRLARAARSWRAPTPAPTSSSSAAHRHLRPGRSSRPGPAACRSSRSPRAARRRWSRTATPGCSAGPTPITSPAPCCSSPPRRCCARQPRRRRGPRRPRALLGARAGAARRRLPAGPWTPSRVTAAEQVATRPAPPDARPGEASDGAAVRWLDRRSRALLQPRALLARLQRAGAGAGRGPRGAAARAAQLLRDLRLQPRRVLHGPGRRPARPDRRRDRRPRPRRPRARASRSTRSSARVLRAGPRACTRCFDGELRPALARARDPDRLARRRPTRSERARARRALPRADLPGADAAGGRPRAGPSPTSRTSRSASACCCATPSSGDRDLARVKVPKELLGRFLPVGDGGTAFVPLEEVIAAHLDALFPGMEIVDYGVFRVTRDADFEVSDEADDLLQAVEDELRRRRFGEVVRVEIARRDEPDSCATQLIERAAASRTREVYTVDGLLDLGDLWRDRRRPRPRRAARRAAGRRSPSRACSGEDERAGRRVRARCARATSSSTTPTTPSPTSVERFVEQAVADPDVLAIKQTVYRTSDDSPLVPALIRAAERGKQAVCTGRAEGALRRGRPTSTGRRRWRRPACTSSTASRR